MHSLGDPHENYCIIDPIWGMGFPGVANGKKSACQYRKHKRHRFDTWVGKIPWSRKWQPTLVFLPGKSHGQRSLVDTVHGVVWSWTRLKRLSRHAHTTSPRNTCQWNQLLPVEWKKLFSVPFKPPWLDVLYEQHRGTLLCHLNANVSQLLIPTTVTWDRRDILGIFID